MQDWVKDLESFYCSSSNHGPLHFTASQLSLASQIARTQSHHIGFRQDCQAWCLIRMLPGGEDSFCGRLTSRCYVVVFKFIALQRKWLRLTCGDPKQSGGLSEMFLQMLSVLCSPQVISWAVINAPFKLGHTSTPSHQLACPQISHPEVQRKRG